VAKAKRLQGEGMGLRGIAEAGMQRQHLEGCAGVDAQEIAAQGVLKRNDPDFEGGKRVSGLTWG
jgi:hypothetical protein